MALRFQAEDDVDRMDMRDVLRTIGVLLVVLFCAGAAKVLCWLSGGCSMSHERVLTWIIGIVLLWLIVGAISRQISKIDARTKEIDGKVSAIEQAVIAFKEYHGKLIEKLESIEQKLDDASARLESLNPDANEQTIKWDYPKKRRLPADIATDFDISRAVSKAIQETGATSFAETGLVTKAARSHLKSKSFDEMELQSAIAQVDFLRRPSVSAS